MKRSGDLVIARDRVIERLRKLRGTGIPVTGVHDQLQCWGVQITRSPDHQITRSDKRLGRFWALFITTLREIFDEAAYERFLVRTHSARSVASYRKFLSERESGIARRPRCC